MLINTENLNVQTIWIKEKNNTEKNRKKNKFNVTALEQGLLTYLTGQHVYLNPMYNQNIT